MNHFGHDCNARNDDKILALRIRHGAAGYGIYFMLLERMCGTRDYMCVKNYNTLAFDLRCDAGLLKSVVEDFGLFTFTDDGKCFYSYAFLKRMHKQDDVSHKRSIAGKKGGRPKKEKVERIPASERIVPVEAPEDFFAGMITDNWLTMMCMHYYRDRTQMLEYIDKFRAECQCRGTIHRDINDCKRHFNDWLRIITQNENKSKSNANNRSNTENQRRGTACPSPADADYTGSF